MFITLCWFSNPNYVSFSFWNCVILCYVPLLLVWNSERLYYIYCIFLILFPISLFIILHNHFWLYIVSPLFIQTFPAFLLDQFHCHFLLISFLSTFFFCPHLFFLIYFSTLPFFSNFLPLHSAISLTIVYCFSYNCRSICLLLLLYFIKLFQPFEGWHLLLFDLLMSATISQFRVFNSEPKISFISFAVHLIILVNILHN